MSQMELEGLEYICEFSRKRIIQIEKMEKQICTIHSPQRAVSSPCEHFWKYANLLDSESRLE